MKNSRKIIIGFLMTIFTAVFIPGCRQMSETVRDDTAGMNGSFELIKSGLPVNWLFYTPGTIPTGDYDLLIDTTQFKDGKQSLKFRVRECSPDGGWHSPGFSKEYHAIPGEIYGVSFWVKNSGSEFIIQIGGVSAVDGKYETIVKTTENLDPWKYFEYYFTMPQDKKFDKIRFELNILQPGSFWIDDIKIVGPDGKVVMPA